MQLHTLAQQLRASVQLGAQHPQWLVLTGAIALWLIGQISGAWLLFLPAASLFALLALAYIWPRWQLHAVQVERQAPRHLRAGQSALLHYSLRSRWPVWQLQLRQALPCSDGLEPSQLPIAFLSAQQRFELPIRPAQSGLFNLGAVELHCAFPFGLWPAQRHIPLPTTELWVYPRIIHWRHSPDLAGQGFGRASPQAGQTRVGDYFYQLREYHHSDGPALIDWKSSAKYGQWRVKCFAPETQPRILLALDTRPAFNLGTGRHNSRVVQHSLAASLCRHWCAKGCEVWCISEHGCRKLPAFNQHFEPLDEFLISLPQQGHYAPWQLLHEYAPRSQSQLWVQFSLRSQAHEPNLPEGVNLWNLLLDDDSFERPLARHSIQAPRREPPIWDFHLGATMAWEQLFDAVP